MNWLKENALTLMQFAVTLLVVVPFWMMLHGLAEMRDMREVYIQLIGTIGGTFALAVGFWLGRASARRDVEKEDK